MPTLPPMPGEAHIQGAVEGTHPGAGEGHDLLRWAAIADRDESSSSESDASYANLMAEENGLEEDGRPAKHSDDNDTASDDDIGTASDNDNDNDGHGDGGSYDKTGGESTHARNTGEAAVESSGETRHLIHLPPH